MQIIKGDLLAIESGIIAHQVNCKGVMGAGLAKSLKRKFPNAFASYAKYCQLGQFKLGMIQIVPVGNNLFVANMAGQDGYGTGKQTDYDALQLCLTKLHTKSIELGLVSYLPYKLGCGLAGGDWAIVSGLIESYCPNAVIVQL